METRPPDPCRHEALLGVLGHGSTVEDNVPPLVALADLDQHPGPLAVTHDSAKLVGETDQEGDHNRAVAVPVGRGSTVTVAVFLVDSWSQFVLLAPSRVLEDATNGLLRSVFFCLVHLASSGYGLQSVMLVCL